MIFVETARIRDKISPYGLRIIYCYVKYPPIYNSSKDSTAIAIKLLKNNSLLRFLKNYLPPHRFLVIKIQTFINPNKISLHK